MTPEGPDCWPKKDSKRQWIVFYKLDNMTFSGTGTIEGNGEKWWELPCKPHRVSHFFCFFDFRLSYYLVVVSAYVFYIVLLKRGCNENNCYYHLR